MIWKSNLGYNLVYFPTRLGSCWKQERLIVKSCNKCLAIPSRPKLTFLEFKQPYKVEMLQWFVAFPEAEKTCVTSECNNGLLRSFAVKLSLNLKSKDPFMKVGKNEEYRLSSSGYMRFAHVYMKLEKGSCFLTVT